MTHPEIILILARAANGVIGANGGIPWRIPGDQRRFKALTMGKPMIMGRKTFESLPGLLPGRRHIVLTRDMAWEDEGAEVAANREEAIRLANAPHIAVIGGAAIYDMFMDIADRIELTLVHAEPAGDAVISLPDPALWTETSRECHPAEHGVPGYDFVTWLRKSGE